MASTPAQRPPAQRPPAQRPPPRASQRRLSRPALSSLPLFSASAAICTGHTAGGSTNVAASRITRARCCHERRGECGGLVLSSALLQPHPRAPSVPRASPASDPPNRIAACQCAGPCSYLHARPPPHGPSRLGRVPLVSATLSRPRERARPPHSAAPSDMSSLPENTRATQCSNLRPPRLGRVLTWVRRRRRSLTEAAADPRCACPAAAPSEAWPCRGRCCNDRMALGTPCRAPRWARRGAWPR